MPPRKPCIERKAEPSPRADAFDREKVEDLIYRLSPDGCPFCHRDPYHYVDIGVGMMPAAVDCCDLGISLFQYRDEQLQAVSDTMAEAATLIRSLAGPEPSS